MTGRAASQGGNTRRLRLLTFWAATATLALAADLALRTTTAPSLTVVAVFGIALIAAENAAIVLPSTLRVSPSVFLVLAAISAFAGRGAIVGAMAVGAVGPLVVSHLRRRRYCVVIFNSAQYALAAAAAAGVHEALRSAGTPVAAAAAAGAAAFAVANMALVTPAAMAESGASPAALVADMAPALPAFVGFGLLGALVGRLYVARGAPIVIGILCLAVIARSVFAAIVALRRARVRLAAVHGFAAGLNGSDDEAAATITVLHEARSRLQAEVAELVLCAPGETGAWRIVLGPSGVPEHTRLHGPVRELEAVAGGPMLASYWERGLDDVMIAPVAHDGVTGALLVGNRRHELGPFVAEDLSAFSLLANHAAVALANGRLLDRILWDAQHDPVTTLPNRSGFAEVVDRICAERAPCAVLLIDIDHFRDVNDTLGHECGDHLLAAIGSRLVVEAGAGGTVARLGGDEFAVLLPRAENGDAARVAVRVLAALDEPFHIDGFSLEITASLGIALLPGHGQDADGLLRRADVALHAAKAQHSGWEVYRADQDQSSRRRLGLAGELRHALDCDELEVFYQPVADLRTGGFIGMEALIRWPHPEQGMLLPDDFVPIAETAGLIRPLTIYVLRDAARYCSELQRQGFDLDVAVNLSVRSVLDVGLPELVARTLAEFGLGSHSLVLEITESSVMADPSRSVGVLSRLAALGVRISIDDFGTGYSSLSHLRRLPVDEVKIDRSFVAGMLANSSDAVIVRSTIDLSRNLGLRVVAEGVENEATWDLLVDLGCDAAQGYYLSRPVNALAFTSLLRGTTGTPVPPHG